MIIKNRGSYGRKIEVGDKGWHRTFGPTYYCITITKTTPTDIYFEVFDKGGSNKVSLSRFLFRILHQHVNDI